MPRDKTDHASSIGNDNASFAASSRRNRSSSSKRRPATSSGSHSDTASNQTGGDSTTLLSGTSGGSAPKSSSNRNKSRSGSEKRRSKNGKDGADAGGADDDEYWRFVVFDGMYREAAQPLLTDRGAVAAQSAASAASVALGSGAPAPAGTVLNTTMNNAVRRFAPNSVSTAKYSFIPIMPNFVVWRNLYEQFHKAANLYFLLISALQLIPGLSPTGRFTTLLPLIVVLIVTMIKDLVEDITRHRSDAELNGRTTFTWGVKQPGGTPEWVETAWRDVKVGDVVRVAKGEAFPADLALVWSSLAEGSCYIETASLDGETNLKLRKACQGIYKAFDSQNPSSVNSGMLGAMVTCERPNDRLYSFEGYFQRAHPPTVVRQQLLLGRPLELHENVKIPITADNILLRGANLRNTPDIIGIVIFTGEETKLMKNSSAKSTKMSRVDHTTNRQILYVFCFLLLLCLGSTVGSAMARSTVTDSWYLPAATGSSPLANSNSVVQTVAAFGTFLILFNNLIPISLYVSLEMVKLLLSKLINNDLEMYHAPTDTPALTRSSSIVEELGQVEYVFSDKTGTLTCNVMDFLKFTVCHGDPFTRRLEAVAYGTGTTEIARSAALREKRTLPDDGRPKDWRPDPDGFCFYDPRVSRGAWARQPGNVAADLEYFLVFMAICNNVMTEGGGPNDVGNIVYQAASPDEACLVKAARSLGVALVARTDDQVVISVNGALQTWEVMTTIEFDSARKRMSIVVRPPGSSRLLLMCKGADSVMFERLRADPSRSHAQTVTQDTLTKFAEEGLRTLVLAQAELDEEFFDKWSARYNEAATALQDRAGKMAMVAESLEVNLDLVGSTAIEDRLQEGVPNTIELLAKAGIKVWVLTGDKQETAINIAFACSLLHDDMGIFLFDDCLEELAEATAAAAVQNKLKGAGTSDDDQDGRRRKAERGDNDKAAGQATSAPTQAAMRAALYRQMQHYLDDAKIAFKEQDLALVIQGDALDAIFSSRNKKEAQAFLQLATHCRAVVCCRVSPLQKAQIVRLVRDNMDVVTLAIGDGANDVSMIQAAHVGVGISGLEGLQAARASDFSIAQFRYLQRLLLIHGRSAYRRICRVILFSFFKNLVLFLTQFWFAVMNLFTGQSLYDSWALSCYNVIFSMYPILVLGVLDRDVDQAALLSPSMFPDLYQEGVKGTLLNTGTFWLYMANAVFCSLMSFIVPLYVAQFWISIGGTSAATLSWDATTSSSATPAPSATGNSSAPASTTLAPDSASFDASLYSRAGHNLGLHSTGIMIYTIVLIVVSVKVGLETTTWTVPNVLSIALSLLAWFCFLLIYGNFFAWVQYPDFAAWYGAPVTTLGQPLFWLTVLLTCTICLLRDVAYKFYRQYFSPKLSHLVRELAHEAKSREAARARAGRSSSAIKAGANAAAKGGNGLGYSRKDVMRTLPHLLPKFDSLRPYDPVRDTRDGPSIGLADLNVPIVTSVARTTLGSLTETLIGSSSGAYSPNHYDIAGSGADGSAGGGAADGSGGTNRSAFARSGGFGARGDSSGVEMAHVATASNARVSTGGGGGGSRIGSMLRGQAAFARPGSLNIKDIVFDFEDGGL